MQAAPNRSVVTGMLRACVPAPDGYGSHLEIEVTAAEPQQAGADFIQPAVGKTLRAFIAPQPELDAAPALIGTRVEVTLVYLGGPSGGQAVVQRLQASRR